MAMDALKNLVNNVPDWLQRLDDLSGQIDRRQAELAAVAAAEGKSAETKSLRNKGSTESLKPKDDPPVVHAEVPANEDILEDGAGDNTAQTPVKPETPKVHTPSPGSIRQQQEIIKAAQARARAQVRKKPKSPSMMSNEDAPAAYRTRSMIIVYYDSYVQSFFDDLVRFVSSSRNLMRKAKMAARVAQIKKLAEQDVSEDGSNDDALPSLRYMSSRRFGPMSISRPGAGDQPPDVYDKLDKGLEFVQSMCEHGAHQFLRDGDCNDEISKVQKRLTEVLEMAKTEMERVEREEPELAKETGEMGKVRTRRPISMRRDMTVGLKESSPTPTKEENKLEPAKLEAAEPIIAADPMAPMAVDPNIMEADEGIDVEMELPKLQYRSTRAMRSRGP
ncbi:hypothetical protein FOCG_02666 [Fusarium oxysporum f. sp. radicis-lycopersici 26381]|uniref:Uncharacterized protein n=11 Tax=Fusarium oxysporum species complex TaxID=171631 RepID=A0A2H3HU52_FUSOX|nr:hypothetical protein FOXG_06374 [Fusarium oxysporum f. sp. lycopersici 4287]XP_031056392.1 uncharacterized protein FOIG_12866 [Fusarium odoratissimum NRRL 54006]XP_054560193.1 uncharacterized protein FOBCDRAFT_132082 [Fusarium oxysporum Fo47]EXA00747.1 hypothetical protein FOWG_00866 [Fusarium oxysporum f. sp. lycopersici MN25]EXK35288.1 hypothetical protein FOMG_10464 [Fusarium oxysporum f. sp. melonis 26406]EXL59433.1 hypothetical protein FOCG_02666 [Fusarium oxysporum f. sp. radicis-lyco